MSDGSTGAQRTLAIVDFPGAYGKLNFSFHQLASARQVVSPPSVSHRSISAKRA